MDNYKPSSFGAGLAVGVGIPVIAGVVSAVSGLGWLGVTAVTLTMVAAQHIIPGSEAIYRLLVGRDDDYSKFSSTSIELQRLLARGIDRILGTTPKETEEVSRMAEIPDAPTVRMPEGGMAPGEHAAEVDRGRASGRGDGAELSGR